MVKQLLGGLRTENPCRLVNAIFVRRYVSSRPSQGARKHGVPDAKGCAPGDVVVAAFRPESIRIITSPRFVEEIASDLYAGAANAGYRARRRRPNGPGAADDKLVRLAPVFCGWPGFGERNVIDPVMINAAGPARFFDLGLRSWWRWSCGSPRFYRATGWALSNPTSRSPSGRAA